MVIATPTGGTRLKILGILQREGSMTVDKLAREVGLSSTTIRRHLDILQRDLLVSFDQIRQGSGRPEYLYFLTEYGHESGSRDYKSFLVDLVTEISGLTSTDLSAKNGKELLSFLIARIADQVSWPYLQPSRSSTDARVAKLELALSDRGFAPEITRKGDQLEIRLCNCPLRSAALCQEAVCLFDHTLISAILQVDPVRESSIHDGHTTCLYVAALEN